MFLERDGVQLYYDIHGEGEPTLLFIHGWLMSHEVWREQLEPFDNPVTSPDYFTGLAENCTIVRVDLRGFGESDKPDSAYDYDEYLADLDFVISELRLEKPILVGWSMGASLALAYAHQHPERVGKLVLVGATPLLMATRDFEYGVDPEAADELMRAIQADLDFGSRGFIDLMFEEEGPEIEEMKEMLHDLAQQTTRPIALKSVNNIGGRDLRPILPEISVPTIIMVGTHDRICSIDASRYLHQQISNSKMITFAGKGHVPFLTDHDAFNKALAVFATQ